MKSQPVYTASELNELFTNYRYDTATRLILSMNIKGEIIDSLISEVKKRPEYSARLILFHLGKSFKASGRTIDAIKFFEELLLFKPAKPSTYYLLACLYYKMKRYEETQEMLNHCHVNLKYPSSLMLQFQLWRKMKRYDILAEKSEEYLKRHDLPKEIREDIQVTLGFAGLHYFYDHPKRQDIFDSIKDHFMNLTDTIADACYGLVFLYEVAYKQGLVIRDEAERQMSNFVRQGFKIDTSHNSKHYIQAEKALARIQKHL